MNPPDILSAEGAESIAGAHHATSTGDKRKRNDDQEGRPAKVPSIQGTEMSAIRQELAAQRKILDSHTVKLDSHTAKLDKIVELLTDRD